MGFLTEDPIPWRIGVSRWLLWAWLGKPRLPGLEPDEPTPGAYLSEREVEQLYESIRLINTTAAAIDNLEQDFPEKRDEATVRMAEYTKGLDHG